MLELALWNPPVIVTLKLWSYFKILTCHTNIGDLHNISEMCWAVTNSKMTHSFQYKARCENDQFLKRLQFVKNYGCKMTRKQLVGAKEVYFPLRQVEAEFLKIMPKLQILLDKVKITFNKNSKQKRLSLSNLLRAAILDFMTSLHCRYC